MKNVVILTSSKHGKPFIGDEQFYKKLITQLKDRNAEGYVFPFSMQNRELIAYKWQPDTSTWLKTTCPKPSVVYNRYPYRELEKNKQVQSYLKFLEEENIPFFNSCFFRKENVAQLLQKNRYTAVHFPNTVPVTNVIAFKHFLDKYSEVFIKDVHGSQGNGIWKVTKHRDDCYTLVSQRKTFHDLSFKKIMYLLTPLFKKRQLILQEGIPLKQVDEFRYDFRILMHFVKNKWSLIGFAPRVAKKDGLTTHVPKGGKLVSVNDVPFIPPEKKIKEIGRSIGKLLQQRFGNVNEFSFDLGVDESNHPWIFDVNSKPMVFDEEHIQEKCIRSLAYMLLSTTNEK
ncbi:YheC/YheD family protein [Bacillus shivajii]|uniref:YheC/YheD family endospore coat-associated protein n=1 Tax=Bacillus shivajii TaxID=1983719 RepID=UPI001CFC3C4E|nr:YheC/YheD family protein [Bacillus shivajii]UCZ54294.1 YheC/YheD family protein [Bacillus shivajii]